MWSGAGLEWSATGASKRIVEQRAAWQRGVARGICLFVGAAITLAAFESVRAVGELAQAGDRVSKEVGVWMAADARLRAVTGRPIVMGIGLSSPYYAGGTMRYLPYASEEAALAYIHRMQPHYLVVRELEVEQMPYARGWLQRGIPDGCAVLAREEWSSSSDRSRVWRWTCGATGSRPATRLPAAVPVFVQAVNGGLAPGGAAAALAAGVPAALTVGQRAV